jgi:hypothetical protein
MNSSAETQTTAVAAWSATPAPRSRLRFILPALLILIYLCECGWFIRTQSFTFDEPVHIVTGWNMWRNGRFEYWNDHPPLQRLLCTLPIVGQKWQMDVQGHFPEFLALKFHPGPEEMAAHGRSVSLVLGLILALLLWTTARRMFSEGAANVALALFVFSPALIAHFSLATTDGIGVLSIFATAVQLLRWRRNPSHPQTILLGVVMGVLLLAKFYTPPMFIVAAAWILILKHDRIALNPQRWNWLTLVAVGIVAFLLLWSGYFFHISRLTMRNGEMVATFPNRDPIIKKMRTPIPFSIPIPAGEYLEGLRSVAFHNHRGHQAFFLGRAKKLGSWRLYYPVDILLKWPTVVLVLFLMALVFAVRRRVRLPHDLLIMLSFPGVYLVFALLSKIDIGDRHVLPLYPFVLLFVAGVWWTLARSSKTALALIILAIALHAVDSFRYAPDYLGYFTPFIAPDQSYKLLSDSNLDWGQGLLALHEYQSDHPDEKIFLSYFGSVDPAAYGLRVEPLAEGQRVAGATVIVSSTQLTGQMLENPMSYRWVLKYPEKAVLNHSLHVFAIPVAPVR